MPVRSLVFSLICVLGAGVAPGQVDAIAASAVPGADAPCRGMAFLASEIGAGSSVREIVEFTSTCRLNLVVFDFAWITHHWPRANAQAIRELCDRLRERGTQVAIMYRPRVLQPGEASLHYAQNANGQIAPSHNDLCFAHEDSTAWAIDWGNRIRSAFPSVDTIVLYNLRASCRCPECRDGKVADHIATFLRRCRREWARPKSPVRIGHVGVADEYADEVDFLCPFLAVNRTQDSPPDFTADVARLVRLRSAQAGRPITTLLKVCWAEETRNSSEDIVRAIKACNARKAGFIVWYYEWVFHCPDHRYDRDSIVASLKAATQEEPQ